MKYLPLAFLLASACSPELPETCQPQVEHFEDVCARSEVIGTHENAELYSALEAVKACAGSKVQAVCSDAGAFSTPRTTWAYEN